MVARRTIRITAAPFDVTSELRDIGQGDLEIGAIVSFTGVVRGTAKGKAIVGMGLEHYPGMTETELGRIVGEAEARWPLNAVTIVHRIGQLAPGDLIVLVAVASSHRQAAFEAGAYIMDFLKTRAPFWKRETFSDGSGGWVDARETDQVAAQRWAVRQDA